MKLEKSRSRHGISIREGEIDPWFLFVERFEKSTGKLLSSSMIIRKDLDDWVSLLESQGWIISDNTGVSGFH